MMSRAKHKPPYDYTAYEEYNLENLLAEFKAKHSELFKDTRGLYITSEPSISNALKGWRLATNSICWDWLVSKLGEPGDGRAALAIAHYLIAEQDVSEATLFLVWLGSDEPRWTSVVKGGHPRDVVVNHLRVWLDGEKQKAQRHQQTATENFNQLPDRLTDALVRSADSVCPNWRNISRFPPGTIEVIKERTPGGVDLTADAVRKRLSRVKKNN